MFVLLAKIKPSNFDKCCMRKQLLVLSDWLVFVAGRTNSNYTRLLVSAKSDYKMYETEYIPKTYLSRPIPGLSVTSISIIK